jgi:hypothetical protein
MPDKAFLLQQAAQCRRLAGSQTDRRVCDELLKMAAELEAKASETPTRDSR